MARTRLSDIRDEAKFGKRLFKLGQEQGLNGPAAIAKAIYANDECFKLFAPGNRTYKYEVNKDNRDIPTIQRRVDDHLDAENAYDVSGNYLLAYSILFKCSLDYFYGKIDVPCPNVEVLDISKKTGLSVKAVERLMEKKEVCLEEQLLTADQYGLLDMPSYSDEDDGYINTYASVTDFWSRIMESELFSVLPVNWYRMACALYTSKGVKIIADDAQRTWDDLPSVESFLSWVEEWNTLYPDEPLFRINGLSEEEIREIYEKEPKLIKQIYREIRHKHTYSTIERAEELETVYWGCAGKFDRHTLEFFHREAEEWCKKGPLPPIQDCL